MRECGVLLRSQICLRLSKLSYIRERIVSHLKIFNKEKMGKTLPKAFGTYRGRLWDLFCHPHLS
jgi:hypothetical protein